MDMNEVHKLIVDNSSEGIILVQDGRIIFANKRFLEYLRITEEELNSKGFIDYIHPGDREMILSLYLKKIAGEDVPLGKVYRIINAEGNIRWVNSRSTVLTYEEMRRGSKPAASGS